MPSPPRATVSERRKLLFDTLTKLKEGSCSAPWDRCLYWAEECHDPIGSHSLSKCWLETISFQGHVVKIKAWPRKSEDGAPNLTISPELVGQNEVSVFRGFCNRHDTSLFRSLDTLDVEPSTEDCMKLIYRSVTREFAAKYHAVKVLLEAGMREDPKAFEMILLRYKFEVENALISGSYGDYEHLVIEIGSKLNYVGTVTFNPLVTARGRLLNANNEQMTLTLLPTNSGGFAVLSWNRIGSPNAAKFAHALRRTPHHLIGMAVGRMFFEMSDNVVFSPVFWYGVPEESKQAVVDMHARSIPTEEKMPPAKALVPNYKVDHPFTFEVSGTRTLS
jgi:hypothetical protein